MSGSNLRVAAGQRDVHVGNLEHGEALADDVEAAEALKDLSQPPGGHPEHFDIDVLRRDAEQSIAYPAAHEQGAAALVLDRTRDRDSRLDAHSGCWTLDLRRRSYRRIKESVSFGATAL